LRHYILNAIEIIQIAPFVVLPPGTSFHPAHAQPTVHGIVIFYVVALEEIRHTTPAGRAFPSFTATLLSAISLGHLGFCGTTCSRGHFFKVFLVIDVCIRVSI
jgi:hypothetical protein